MIENIHEYDSRITGRLDELSGMDEEYWSFRQVVGRQHSHAYFQYPAMMVPQVQSALIKVVVDCMQGPTHIIDPFAGSGTVLSEAMIHGCDFFGQDVNPLAILLCKTKSGPFYSDVLEEKFDDICRRATLDTSCKIDIDFPGISKWFTIDVSLELSRLRRAIGYEPERWARRFFWVVLAEVIRRTSNSRTSTFKLHIRPAAELETRCLSPIALFREVGKGNIEKHRSQRRLLKERGLLHLGRYSGKSVVRVGDTAERIRSKAKFDLLVTSPPYGDNKSTVPYGQFSYLALQWIDLSDIDPEIDRSYLASTHEIDSRSLGGTLHCALQSSDYLRELSPSFRRVMEELRVEERDRQVRVSAFLRDLDKSVTSILSALRPDAYLIWTIGNRRVGNRVIPTDEILAELLEARDVKLLRTFHRSIHFKRMAHKNTVTSTMRSEKILLLRKGAS